jgi:hypothetical protein
MVRAPVRVDAIPAVALKYVTALGTLSGKTRLEPCFAA